MFCIVSGLMLTIVFTKCAENLENGRRLENFSWRLWYREAHFFDAPSLKHTPSATHDQKPSPQPIHSPPEVLSDLSGSVSSTSDSDCEHRHVVDQPHDCNNPESHGPTPPCLESPSRRQNVKHLSPDSFKSLIESLEPPDAEAEKWKVLKSKRENEENHSSGTLAPQMMTDIRFVEPIPSTPTLPKDIPFSRSYTMSETHESPNNPSGRSLQRVSSSIVRGFTPENPSISRRLSPPESTNSEPVIAEPRKRPKFYIESSVSDSDGDDVPLTIKPSIKTANKSTLSPPGMKRATSNGSVKKTHFHEIVDTKILPAPPTEESEDEDVEAAVMSDDEDEDWEDSQSDSGDVRDDDHLFDKREDTLLVSRGSMLSTLFKSKSDYNLSSQAFRATNPIVRSHAPPSQPPRPQPLTPSQPNIPAANGIPLRVPVQLNPAGNDTFLQPIPASPRTTRRRMLASELSESLRRNLLWERQHRTTINNTAAALKRRHTSNDLARLKDFPEGVSGKDGKDPFNSEDTVW